MATREAWQTPAKSKGFSSMGPFFLPSPFFAFKAGFLPSLGILSHWALPLPASSNILALMRSQRAQAEYPHSSLSSRQYICIYHGRNNISICRKQLLPPGLQHPRTKISPTNLIHFPVRVLEVWNCLCFHFYGPRGKISIKFSICLLLCGSLRFNHIICNENKSTFKIFFFFKKRTLSTRDMAWTSAKDFKLVNQQRSQINRNECNRSDLFQLRLTSLLSSTAKNPGLQE